MSQRGCKYNIYWRNTTCSLTEARMLLAVLSVSILRPVELSQMVSRSPSSVTGLCSGAGIPPVWIRTNKQWFGLNSGSMKHLVHTAEYAHACANTHHSLIWLDSTLLCYTLANDAEKWLWVVTHCTSSTQTHTHTSHMAQIQKDCQCFMSVTVQIIAIWAWDSTQLKKIFVYKILYHWKIETQTEWQLVFVSMIKKDEMKKIKLRSPWTWRNPP